MLSKYWITIILFFCICCAVSATERTVIINDVAWPPYFFIDSETDELGIGKEILTYCLAQSDYKVNYVRLPIKRTHHYMEHGIIDLTVYSYRQSREEILYYSKEPIFTSEYGFLVRADSGIDIKKLDDVKPYQIGHLAGLSYTIDYMDIINEKIKLNQVSIGHSLDSMFLQLLAPIPRFDIMADSKSTFKWFAHKKGVYDQIKVLDYTLKNKTYFITISKRSKNIENPLKLLNETDACIKKLKQEGSYKTLLTKYGMDITEKSP